MRRRVFLSALVGAIIVLVTARAAAGGSKINQEGSAQPAEQDIQTESASVQVVSFPDTVWSRVKIVRGGSPANNQAGQNPNSEKPETAEIVSFADPQATSVRVIRGDALTAPGQARSTKVMDMQVISFESSGNQTVTVFRGAGSHGAENALFTPALADDLDRVAFAVDGAESSHGLDLRMWHPEPGGPQGPMQITEAAAIDVGGGDRFDIIENRALGRAYLALMYRRYGNWPDAIAAYNWGPGNVDAWIGGGRAASTLPLEVERYRDRVLRDAAVLGAARIGQHSFP